MTQKQCCSVRKRHGFCVRSTSLLLSLEYLSGRNFLLQFCESHEALPSVFRVFAGCTPGRIECADFLTVAVKNVKYFDSLQSLQLISFFSLSLQNAPQFRSHWKEPRLLRLCIHGSQVDSSCLEVDLPHVRESSSPFRIPVIRATSVIGLV
jgi:hypothetical protein